MVEGKQPAPIGQLLLSLSSTVSSLEWPQVCSPAAAHSPGLLSPRHALFMRLAMSTARAAAYAAPHSVLFTAGRPRQSESAHTPEDRQAR